VPQDNSNPYLDQVAVAAEKAGIDPRWAQATLLTENAPGNPSAVSSQGAQGLMQVLPSSAPGVSLADPTTNIATGVAQLAANLKATGGDKSKASAMYFAGPSYSEWGPKTHAYVQKVADNYQALGASQVPATASSNSLTPSLDSFVSQATAAPSAGQSASSSTSLTPSLDGYVSQLTAAQSTPTDPYQIPPLSTAAATAHPIANQVVKIANDIVDNPFAQGIQRGAHVVLDAPAEALAKGATAIGLTGALNDAGIAAPTGAQTVAADQADQNAYRQQYASNPIAQAANYGTQAAMVLPVLEGGVGAIRAGGNALVPAMGDFVTGNAGGNLLTRGTSLAAGGALSNAGGAALTAAGGTEPAGEQILRGAEGGLIAGPALGAAGSVAGKALGGFGVDQYTAQLAQKAINMGIPLRAGQVAENPFIRTADDVIARIPGSGAQGQAEAIQTGFNRAVANEMGTQADRITPDVMAQTKARLGKVFDAVAQNTPSINATPLLGTFADIENEASSALPDSEYQPIKKQMQNILDMVGQDGTITGQQYQNLTRTGSPLMTVLNSRDSNVKFYAGQVRSALDDAMQASAPPEVQQQLTTARTQYKAMKTIEDLVEKSPTGNISPPLLMNVVRQNYGNMAYNGAGNMGDLARIGQMIKPPANSGTPERLAVLSALGGGAGTSIIGALHSPVDAAMGAAGAIGLPVAARIANTALNNPAMRNALIARALGQTTGPSVNALTAAAGQPVGSLIGAETRN
jgi:hypothetical protein